MKNFPLILLIAGGALAFFLWQQRQAQQRALIASLPSEESLIDPRMIAMTPAGYTVPGTTSDPYDWLT